MILYFCCIPILFVQFRFSHLCSFWTYFTDYLLTLFGNELIENRERNSGTSDVLTTLPLLLKSALNMVLHTSLLIFFNVFTLFNKIKLYRYTPLTYVSIRYFARLHCVVANIRAAFTRWPTLLLSILLFLSEDHLEFLRMPYLRPSTLRLCIFWCFPHRFSVEARFLYLIFGLTDGRTFLTLPLHFIGPTYIWHAFNKCWSLLKFLVWRLTSSAVKESAASLKVLTCTFLSNVLLPYLLRSSV